MSWPATSLPVVVEAYLGGAWVDVDSLSTGTVVRGDTRVRITFGGADETPRILAGSADFSINDPDNLFSGLSPNAPYYGDLGLNTPIRVSAAGIFRHYGEIGSMKLSADSTERDRYVVVQSRGILSRLTQGNRALKPALERSIMFRTPFAFWKMDDGTTVNSFGNSVAGQLAMTSNGNVTPATVTGPDGATAALPELVNADIVTSTEAGEGAVTGATGSSWIFEFVHKAVDDGTLTGESTPWTWFTAHMGYELVLSNGGNSVTLTATDLDGTGADILLAPAVTTPIDGEWHQYRVVCSYSAPNTTLTLYRDGVSIDSDSAAGDGGDFDHVHPMAEPPAAVSALTSSSTGYAALYVGTAASSTAAAVTGHTGETVGARLTRLAGEEGLSLTIIGYDEPTHTMGPQSASALATLFQQAADVGQGILHETADAVGVTYRTITDLYNQVPALEIDFAQAHIGSGSGSRLDATFDDQKLENYVTVSRSGGGSTTAALDDGSRLSISDPPTGVGQYDRGGLTVYCEVDTQTGSIAWWRVHLGTYLGYRYAQLPIEQARDEWTSAAAMTADLRALRLGDDIKISNVPERLREIETLVRLQVRGWTEDISRFMWTMNINTVPGWLWEVWELDSGGSSLALAVNTSATSLKLETSSGPEWALTGAGTPYHVQCGGEAMTVTAMARDTPTFIAAGTVAHGNNASVVPGLPAGMTVDSAQLMVCLAAIRNSGTGTVNTPSGWTTIADFGNMRLFGRYYVTGDAAPTVTFTGGVANADTSARIFGFSGLSMKVDGSAVTSLNSSAQNIAYGDLNADTATQGAARRTNHVVLVAGWKQDDWTSVATLSGFVEDADNATTTGDDQGIVLDHRIDTTPAGVSSGSFTVTGGANAISRSIVVALRPLQTATVTRSVNGVSASHAVSDAVKGWRLGVTAL